MKMNTYVNFHGNCAEAFRYYEKHLGAKVGIVMTHAQSPDQSRIGPEWRNAVLHARIVIGDQELMAADIPNAAPMRSAYLTLRMDSDAEAERVFSALSDCGKILMPIEETFFAHALGKYKTDSVLIGWSFMSDRCRREQTRKVYRNSLAMIACLLICATPLR